MKFYFTKSRADDGGGGGGGTTPSTSPNRFHKNLFDAASADLEADLDGYTFEETTTTTTTTFEATSSRDHRVSQLSVPLTDTIAEFARDISDDPFFFNDLSFLFDLSRKRAISPYSIVVALLYLKRLKCKTTSTSTSVTSNDVNSYSSQNVIDSFFGATSSSQRSNDESLSNKELCLVSILLASKFLIDEGEHEGIYNNEWASAANVSVDKINRLEKMVLDRMDWELYVSSDEFWDFTSQLTEKITLKKVKLQLDNCTYSDLDILLTGTSLNFSLESARDLLVLLAKCLALCTSTLVYIVLSSYLASSCALFIKTDLTAIGNMMFTYGSSNNRAQLNATFNNNDDDLRNPRLYMRRLDYVEAKPPPHQHQQQQQNALLPQFATVQSNRTTSYLGVLEDQLCAFNTRMKSLLSFRSAAAPRVQYFKPPDYHDLAFHPSVPRFYANNLNTKLVF